LKALLVTLLLFSSFGFADDDVVPPKTRTPETSSEKTTDKPAEKVTGVAVAPSVIVINNPTTSLQTLTTAGGATTLGGLTVVQPITAGSCPAGYLPQYCAQVVGVQPWSAVCAPATPLFQCIQAGKQNQYFAAYNCSSGNFSCVAQERQLTAIGCPPGAFQSTCLTQIYTQPTILPAQQTAALPLAMALPMMMASQNQNNNMYGRPVYDSGGAGAGHHYSDGYSPAPGGGSCEQCPATLPPQVQKALDEAKTYRAGCRAAQRGTDKKIVINDYSANGDPYMYVFDQNGQCLERGKVTYGDGAGQDSKPRSCSDGGKHLTPAGFMLTAQHSGDKYSTNNPNPWQDGLGLVGLEGQNSVGRGVLLHPARSPGTASSWGCSGVGYDCYFKVKGQVGYGSLVYNYFGNTPPVAGCQNSAGSVDPHTQCSPDPGGDTNSLPPIQSDGTNSVGN
jgi:hypothetical protein